MPKPLPTVSPSETPGRGTPDLVFRQTFPDLALLKGRIAAGWRWPTVLLNCDVTETLRDGIRGPLSLFMNLSGTAEVTVSGRRKRLDENTFVLSNQDEEFTLWYPGRTRTLNLHLAADSVARLWRAVHRGQWESTEVVDPVPELPSSVFRRPPALNRLLVRLVATGKAGQSRLAGDETVLAVVELLLHVRDDFTKAAARLPQLTASAREETLRRLHHARDYLHANWEENPSLDQVARHAALSPYYLIRLFDAWTGHTPARYLARLRVLEADRLMRREGYSVAAAAAQLRYSEPSALSRAYRRVLGHYPTVGGAATGA
jgi:AraC family transcriptional regulator